MFHIVRVVARASPKLTRVRRHSWRSLCAPLDGGCRVRGAEAEAYASAPPEAARPRAEAEAYAGAPPFLAVASHRLVVVVSNHICAAIPGGRESLFSRGRESPYLRRHSWV